MQHNTVMIPQKSFSLFAIFHGTFLSFFQCIFKCLNSIHCRPQSFLKFRQLTPQVSIITHQLSQMHTQASCKSNGSDNRHRCQAQNAQSCLPDDPRESIPQMASSSVQPFLQRANRCQQQKHRHNAYNVG